MFITMIKALLLCLTLTHGSTHEKVIHCLLNKIKNANVEFIRNGSSHTSLEAAKHLKMKYKKANNTGFPFYKKRDITPNTFIEKLASRSSFSGKPYKMKFGKEIINVSNWLKNQLKENCQTSLLQK